MEKYPGSWLVHEVGTNKELAKLYGVSERTIYRWKAKARKETGVKVSTPKRPRVSTLKKFKGTRKQLAKKYNVSERTVYRWLNQAKQKGAEIESRQKRPKSPGVDILLEPGTRKELADKYDVSTSTIGRWRRRARAELQSQGEPITEEQPPEEIPTPDNFADEFAEDFEDMFEVEEPDLNDFDEHELYNLTEISDLLTMGEEPILNNTSLYFNLSPDEQLLYLDAYLRYQYKMDEHQFYNEQTHSMMYDDEDPNVTNPWFISEMGIWGEEFETWLAWQIEARNIEL